VHDSHEYVFHFTKSGNVPVDRLALGVPYGHKSNVERWAGAGSDLRCRGNCWFIPYETIQWRDIERPHPATFPVELAKWCIKLHGLERIGLVLDPFLGLGSSAIASLDLEVPFLGFEIDPFYIEQAIERLALSRT